jgi:hypothetical protein
MWDAILGAVRCTLRTFPNCSSERFIPLFLPSYLLTLPLFLSSYLLLLTLLPLFLLSKLLNLPLSLPLLPHSLLTHPVTQGVHDTSPEDDI